MDGTGTPMTKVCNIERDSSTPLATLARRVLCLVNTDKLECGPMPNVMTALPNVGGALCSTPQTLADVHYSSAAQ